MIKTILPYNLARFKLFCSYEKLYPGKTYKQLMALVNKDMPPKSKII